MDNILNSLSNWENFNATTDLSKRMSGVTKESIEQEVILWQKQIEQLPKIDIKAIRQEVMNWEIGLPREEHAPYEVISGSYAKIINYRDRMAHLMPQVKNWSETFDKAIKSLEDLAPGAFPGTEKDKRAQAKNIVSPFVHLKVEIDRLENFLREMQNSLIWCGDKLDALLREKQSRAKLNYRLGIEGESFTNSFANKKTVEYEEDGDIWRLQE